ncbi:alpha/beta fold hydrolase [Blastochloris tepida]|uniref:Putative 2-succinyl-6-hydroxy-2,4-cyclohexadiene-1-carboxylate synthase n=1 Tax=Blastochloris tepida TaxID=2233851 RepID=A0A348G3C0_9HYPH|nr:alpha/beta fold hydrolase [Blastochloris tepida]BBF94053.1 putative 2-succinyl-6-hydroxy-2,4-cyclohexadiene-1-carboxylate synthase [Blastochloris tepida]
MIPGRHPGALHPAKGKGGAPLVLLHGFLGSPAAWDDVLSALPDHGEAWCPWLPGHGPAAPTPASFEATADWIAAALPKGAILAGYSLGARLALGAALAPLAARPDAPRATLLVSGHVGLATQQERVERDALDAKRTADLRRDLASFVAAWETLPLFASQQRLPAETLGHQRAARLAHDPESLAWAFEVAGLARMPDYRAAIAASRRPLCFLTGARDTRFSALAAALVRPPVVTHDTIAEAGHNLLLEAPAAVAAALRHLMET